MAGLEYICVMQTILSNGTPKTYGKWRFVTIAICCVCLANFCPAQTHKQEAIDIEYQKCVAKDTTCGNVGNCAFIVYGKWEKQMTAIYEKLLRALKKDDEKTALRKAQAAWLAYKEATFVSYDFMFNLPGDKWCRLRHEARIDVVRQRTLELRDYYEYLKKRK